MTLLKATVDRFGSGKDCPLRSVLDRVGDKWSFLILAVLEEGPRRFNEVKRLVGDISHRVLTRKLRDLERDGFVSRTVHQQRPPKVVYELTMLGRSLLEPIRTLLEWTLAAHPEIERARATFDRSCAER